MLTFKAFNEDVDKQIAKRLKEANPNILIVVGGPDYPIHKPNFFKTYPHIDICVKLEGEISELTLKGESLKKDIKNIKLVEPKEFYHEDKHDEIKESMKQVNGDLVLAQNKVEEIEQLKQDFSCKVIELRVPRLDEQRHLLLLQRI